LISTITVDGSPVLNKAKALNDQFQAHEDLDNISTIVITTDNGNEFPNMPDISFSLNGMQQALSNLQVNKANGPDCIPPYNLRTVLKKSLLY